MIVFEIEVNGQSVGTAGADDLSVLTAMITAVGKLGPNSQGTNRGEHDPEIEIRVGGLTSRADGLTPNEHLDWVERKLEPGDVVSVRLLEADKADRPIGSMPQPADGDYQKLYEELSAANPGKLDDE